LTTRGIAASLASPSAIIDPAVARPECAPLQRRLETGMSSARRRFMFQAGATLALGALPVASTRAAPLPTPPPAAPPLLTRVPGGEDYPSRAIRLIVPLAAGGGADIVARIVAERLAQRLGQPVVVENRAGGGTVIGATLVAKAAPDGYTLLLATATTHAINSSLVTNLPYDPVRDFEPIGLVAILPLILVVNPSVPVNSLPELIAYARKNPGKLNFGSAGNGSSFHLAGEMLNMVANIHCVHVPYKGAAPALADLLGGQVQFIFTTIPPALPHVQAGTLKALAVANAKRSTLLPDLPTTAEAGAPGVEASAWNGFVAPAKTRREIIDRLSAELGVIMAMPDMADKLRTAGVEPLYDKPDEFAAFMVEETERYGKVVRVSHAHID